MIWDDKMGGLSIAASDSTAEVIEELWVDDDEPQRKHSNWLRGVAGAVREGVG